MSTQTRSRLSCRKEVENIQLEVGSPYNLFELNIHLAEAVVIAVGLLAHQAKQCRYIVQLQLCLLFWQLQSRGAK
jgi:hypothetical protein